MCLRSLRCVGLSSTSGVVVDVEVFLPNARGCIVSSTLRERIWWAKRVRLSAARSSGTNMWVRSDGVGRFVWPLLHFVIVGTCSDIVYHCFLKFVWYLFDILFFWKCVCMCFLKIGVFQGPGTNHGCKLPLRWLHWNLHAVQDQASCLQWWLPTTTILSSMLWQTRRDGLWQKCVCACHFCRLYWMHSCLSDQFLFAITVPCIIILQKNFRCLNMIFVTLLDALRHSRLFGIHWQEDLLQFLCYPMELFIRFWPRYDLKHCFFVPAFDVYPMELFTKG